MYAKQFDTLRGRTKSSYWMNTCNDRKTTSHSATTYLIHPRQLARRDTKGMFLRAIVKIGTMLENISRNPGLERARAKDYYIIK